MKCNWIENMLSIETDGYSRPCCLETSEDARIAPLSDGILNAFNNRKLIWLRDALTNGFSEDSSPYCNRCENLESFGQSSMRTSTKALSFKRELKLLQFKPSNKCQLACAHCGSDRSSTWAKINKKSPHVINGLTLTDELIEELIELLPNIEVLKFSGGEPFLDPDHWSLLNKIKHVKRDHCKLQYISNGLIKPRVDLWDGWKEVYVSVSVDGHGDSYEWFRRNANWNELLNCVALLRQHCVLSINYAITPYTLLDYNNAKKFWESQNIPFGAYPIVYPMHCSLQQFPLEMAKLIPEWENIPGIMSCAGQDESDLKLYTEWAKQSDKLWNTIGAAEKLFKWMNYVQTN